MKTNRRQTSALPRRRRRIRKLRRLQLLVLLGLATSSTGFAFAQNPTGGNVVAGAATINSVGSTLNVNASSDRAVVNWNSFSVGQGNTANFNLPSASSAILNRVTTAGVPSVIAGQLNSNGNVFLVNPSGVVVGNTGIINTNGFTASTFDTTNREFMNGGPMLFRGSSNAGIVNNGTINTGAGGAHFLGNQFNNNGSITSAGGSITVGSGQVVTYANGVTHVEADMATLQNGYSETAPLINNSGTVRATGAVMSGGEVYLTNPGGRVLNSGIVSGTTSVTISAETVNTIGTIRAGSEVGGSVSISANQAIIQGRVDVSGSQSGGTVTVVANSVDQYAPIDASSTTGLGGTVYIDSSESYTATVSGGIDVSGTGGGNVTLTGPGRIVTSATIQSVGRADSGGSIDVSSDTKTSLLNASLDASGATGGGRIRVGGEVQGGRDLSVDEIGNSNQTLIGPGTTLQATGGTGAGGTAIVWSDDRTQYYGKIDVSGGGGQGGFVELSSAGLLQYRGLDSIDTGGGTVLLDPKNGIIVDQTPTELALITFSLTGSQENFLDTRDNFGSSVALNAEGTRLAVGAIGDDGGSEFIPTSGAVYLFDLDSDNAAAEVELAQVLRDGTSLTNGRTLELELGDAFGSSVGFNAAGDILAVGATGDDFLDFDVNPSLLDDTGAVYLFSLDANDLGATASLPMVIRDETILADGSVFDLRRNETGNGGPELGDDRFGFGVALNAAGDRLAVGADGVPAFLLANGASTHFVYLFEIDPNNLAAAPDLAQTISEDSDPSFSRFDREAFGSSVALNAVGDRLAVGAPEKNFNDGGVYLFELDASDYSRPAVFQQLIEDRTLIDGGSAILNAERTSFGSGVAFDAIGNTLLVGAPRRDGNSGGIYLFELSPTDLSTAPDLILEVSNGSQLATGQRLDITEQRFGTAVTLNGQGSRAAVGANSFDGPNDIETDSGAAYLFDFFVNATSSSFVGQRLNTNAIPRTFPAVNELGRSVALGSDRTQLAVSALGPDGSDTSGQVYFFLLDDDDLETSPTLASQLGDGSGILTPVGIEFLTLDPGDAFGSSLAIANQGQQLVVGASGDDGVGNSDTNSGAVYLFNINPNNPTNAFSLPQVIRNQQTLADFSNLTLGDDSGFGGAIAITEDAQRLAVGASGDGKVFLFEFGAGGFMGPASLSQAIEDGITLSDSNVLNVGMSSIGTGVSINAAGNRLAVGEQNNAGGGVLLFDLNQNDWSAAPHLAQQLRDGTPLADFSTLMLPADALFGGGLDFNDAGDRLAVGQSSTSGQNAVFLFDIDATDLSTTARLMNTIANGTSLQGGAEFQAADGSFGISVSLDGSGDRLAVGNPESNRFHLFDFAGGDFGQSINLAQTITEGTPLNPISGLDSNTNFGVGVSLNGPGDRLAVGSPGSVYLFDVDTSLATVPQLAQVIRRGAGLSNGQTLEVGGLGDSSDFFGVSVSLNETGDILAVGSTSSNEAVYLFGLDGTDLGNLPTLGQRIAPGPEGPVGLTLDQFDEFGRSVALNAAGDRLAVGASSDDGVSMDSTSDFGAVYLFDINSNDLTETATLHSKIDNGISFASGGILSLDVNDGFGTSVSLDGLGSLLVVGAPREDGIANALQQTGNAYIFQVPEPGSSSTTTSLLFDFNRDAVLVEGNLERTVLSVFGSGVSINTDGTVVAISASELTTFNVQEPTVGVGVVHAFDTPDLKTSGGVTLRESIRRPEVTFWGESLDLNGSGELLAVGASADSIGTTDSVAALGSVSLLRFANSPAFPLTGNLAFDDLPADTTFIDPDDIAAILNGGNDLILQFSNDLEIRSDITTAMSGVGTLTLQAGRNINAAGTSINIGDGSLTLEFNSQSALPEQRDPGSPTLRLNNVSIMASGDDSVVEVVPGLLDDILSSGQDPLVQISGSNISANEVIIGQASAGAADQRVIIDGGTMISGSRVTVRGTNTANGIGVDISGSGTELVVTQELLISSLGGIRISEGATLTGVEDANVGLGVIQLGNEPVFADFTNVGDSIQMEDAVIQTENGNITFDLVSLDVFTSNSENAPLIDDGPKFERNSLGLTNSRLAAGGSGNVFIAQAGDDSYQIELAASTISGQDVLIASNLFAFSTDAGFSTIDLSNESQINTAADGELRIFLPQQNSVMVDASSSLNGVAGNDVFDGTGNLINNEGIGEFVGEAVPPLPFDIDYLGTEDANFALYIATTDLTPGLFFTANDGQSSYGEVPQDPGVTITRGMLLDGDTLASIGVGTDFSLTPTSDAGTYTISVVAPDLAPKYRLLGTAEGTFVILPADLFVTGGTYAKTYGETFVFPEDDFTVQGLVNGEMIGPVQWLSPGTRRTADVTNEPYAVGLSVSGAGSFNPLNYNIGFTNGGLTVNPATLSIDPLAQAKTYGDSMLDQSRFEVVGLQNSESISAVSFTSSGIAAAANVGDYDLTTSMVTGSGNGFDPNNYNVQFGSLVDGLMVTPAPLQIQPANQFKLVGETFVFAGNEFTASGLRNGDSVATATLTSEGADADAELGTFPILLTDPEGDFASANYVIQVLTGSFVVQEEPVVPAGVLSTGRLAYDQLERYRAFAETIGTLVPKNFGAIDTSNALPPEQPDDDSLNESSDQPEDNDGEVYLSTTIMAR